MPNRRLIVSFVAFALLFVCTALAVQHEVSKTASAAVQEAHTVEVVQQPLPFTVLQPEQSVYKYVGTVNTNETQPCIVSVKVWDLSTNAPAEGKRLDTYCRIQASGYAAVFLENESEVPLAVYHSMTVAIVK